jgi:hypothetical protein
VSDTFTPTTWAEQLLEDVNKEQPASPAVPIDANTVGDILHWMPAEEPTSDWWNRNNPLNSSVGTSASDGTGSYPDLATGAYYAAGMIDQQNMSSIRQALAADEPVGGGFSAGVVASPWASGHYGGNPEALASTSPGGGPAAAGTGTPGALPNVTVPAGGTSATTAAFGLNTNPGDAFGLFGIPQYVAGSAAAAVWAEVGPFFAKALLVVGGLGLVVLGLSRATGASAAVKSARQNAAKAAGPATLAAAAA